MFTTTRPKLWLFLTAALMGSCCLGGWGLSCLGKAISDEMLWFVEAGKSVKASIEPKAEEMADFRRLQEGEKLTPELLARLEKAASAMSQRTREEWARLDKIPAPERLAKMEEIARDGFAELEKGWSDVSAAIGKKDGDGVKLAFARMKSLGDRVKQDIQYEMEALYGKEAPRLEPGGTDPARPTNSGP
jgi:hypothetical protein